MRRYSFTPRLMLLAVAASFIASLVLAAGAQAIVVQDGTTEAGVALMPAARTSPTETLPSGVNAVTSTAACTDPWLSTDLGGPLLPPGGPFSPPNSDSLCYRGPGGVIHKNETFALTWDAPFPDGSKRNYWPQTKQYVEQFLSDVADGSGSLGSPFAVTAQYNDHGGPALNVSHFGGGCIDYGAASNSACEYPIPSGPGHDYPANGCTPGGDSFVAMDSVTTNQVCLTDAQLQGELSTMIAQTGIIPSTKQGYTPLVTLLLPPGVETCLDAAHTLCSANATLTPPPPVATSQPIADTTVHGLPAGNYEVEVTYEMTGGLESAPSASQAVTASGTNSSITINPPPLAPGAIGWYAYITPDNGTVLMRQGGAQSLSTALQLTSVSGGVAPPTDSNYCSYHSQVNVGGTEVAYVVQPWSAGTSCDEPDVPSIQANPPAQVLETDIGTRLVSPLSQSEIAAIVDPNLNGWMAQDGSEIDDNGVIPPGWNIQNRCMPLGHQLDRVTVGNSAQNPYYLQREFDNAAAIQTDPFTYQGCAPEVDLSPSFVVPSSVDPGDVIQFDGSNTASTLIVPNNGFAWNFGDGTTGSGPSVIHSYTRPGSYNVTLTTTDRGGNTNTLTETVEVLGSGEEPGPAPASTTTSAGSGSASASGGGSGSGSGAGSALLNVRLQLLPQSLKSVLRSGIAVRVSSNKAANGIATVSISRAAAKRAHIAVGRGPTVRIGLGTVASVQNGTVTLRLHLSRAMAKKLAHLGHVTMTVRLALVASGNQRFAIDAAGRY